MNDFIIKSLKNGIKIYFFKDVNMKRFFASYNVNFGTNGYYDKFYLNDKEYHVNPAIAHFLEHYLIECSPNGNMLLKYLDRNYDTNGITYPEVTTYYFEAIDNKENIDSSLRELIEMIERPTFNEENVKKVKSAIIEELKKGGDNIYQIARSNNRHNLHKNYDEVPVNNNILGSIESTTAITLDEIESCYDAYYNDENKFLVIGGNIDIDEVFDLLENIFSSIDRHPNHMREFDYGHDTDVRCQKEIIEIRGEVDFVTVSYKFPDIKKFSTLNSALYLSILLSMKFDSGSKFIESLVKEDLIVDEIYYQTDFFKDEICMTFSFESNESDAVIAKIESHIKDDDLSEREFELLKKTYIANEIKRKDYIYSTLMKFPTVKVFSEHFTDIDSVKSLTFDSLKEVRDMIKLDTKTITIITDKKTD